MTKKQLISFFKKQDDDFLKNDAIKPERRLNGRPDLNAFILIDRLVREHFVKAQADMPELAKRNDDPEETQRRLTQDIVSGAKHDEFFLSVDLDQLDLATEEDLLDLIRCGIRIDDYEEGFCMFA